MSEPTGMRSEDSGLKRFLQTGKQWPILLVVLFLTQASIMVLTAVVASGRGSKPIDAGYYAKSLDWDAEHAVRSRAEELGWSITPRVSDPIGDGTDRTIEIALLGADAEPVRDAIVRVEMYHRARSDQRVIVVLPWSETGVYTGSAEMDMMGIWDLQISIRARGELVMVTRVVQTREG